LVKVKNKDGCSVTAAILDVLLRGAGMVKQRRAFTVIELILIVIFIGVFAAISIPRLNFASISRNKADIVARNIVTDLRRTRTLAISDAADNTYGFELRMVSPAPYASYEIADLGPPPTTVDTLTIDSNVSISCPGDHHFRFGPLGNLKAGSGTELTVAAEGKSFTITIISATGLVKCVEN
jgi:type II secretory pathway pseudopilin PulG